MISRLIAEVGSLYSGLASCTASAARQVRERFSPFQAFGAGDEQDRSQSWQLEELFVRSSSLLGSNEGLKAHVRLKMPPKPSKKHQKARMLQLP